MANLAIIPARGGSKRIPQKNVRNFLGKPIITYPINAAKNCGLFDEIMVSTDSDEIASLAHCLQVNVPFKRSDKNADDFATLTDVLLEVLTNYKNIKKHFDFVCLILPTAVFVSGERLKEAYSRLLNNSHISGVVPVTQFSHPVQRAFIINEGNELKMLYPEYINSRTQDMPATFYDSGQFYWIRTSNFLTEKKIFMNRTNAIELPAYEIQDIDTEDDWKMAELKYSLIRSKK
jgi:pseudaminic acid cytidylyltransferase